MLAYVNIVIAGKLTTIE